MDVAEVKALIPLLVKDDCSEATVQAFEAWMASATYVEVSEILDIYYQSLRNQPDPNDNFRQLTHKIEARLDLADLAAANPAPQHIGKYYTTRRWLSVAAIFILFIGGAYVFKSTFFSAPPLASIEKRYKNDVAPGSNKAILTLGDGSKVALDETGNGTIKKQAGVSINKQGHELTYNGSASNTDFGVIYNSVATPRGGQYQLALPDGSKVWLNAESSLRFPIAFSGNSREVTLTGEAYFEVAKNAEKPFIVHVKEMDVRVLGTHFNVMAYNDEAAIKTTLAEGSVKLTNGSATQLLVPSKVASLQQNNFTVADANMDQELAWKNGYFFFDKAGVQTIMRQIARWYDVEVSFEGKLPTSLFVGEMNRASSLAQALKILELSGIHFKIEGKKVIVLE
ncbi:FecR family protein [Parasediminibacterium sp. JCM 36343]|uniref:FecR family protein n=1 Tax=Parasediminibacterium sp. JCM 36343 TaxID=3374279 RepID=UPI00397A6594